MTKPKVAILIPTINRSEFLIRQLRYYVSVNSPHAVYISDASEEDRRRIEDEIKKIGQRLSIHYHMDFMPVYNAIVQASEKKELFL